uniref:Secreted protein n=1 Tax=Panagrellus redivivus TaxID=6233 RepID=A0A7E4V8X6_PANRE
MPIDTDAQWSRAMLLFVFVPFHSGFVGPWPWPWGAMKKEGGPKKGRRNCEMPMQMASKQFELVTSKTVVKPVKTVSKHRANSQPPPCRSGIRPF